MYISRVEIDRNNRRKIRDLSHVGAYHNWIEQSFPEEIKNKERSRKLWRMDQINGRDYLLLISSVKPNLELLERYGVKGSGSTKSYEPFLNSLKNGQMMNFRVTLNPVISKSQGTGNRSKVMPHVTVEHQLNFLLDRAEKLGFNLKEENVTIVERGYELLKRSNGKPIRIVKVVYEGVLTIENVEQFTETLANGIGKKKAFGFGMMTVIPVVQ